MQPSPQLVKPPASPPVLLRRGVTSIPSDVHIRIRLVAGRLAGTQLVFRLTDGVETTARLLEFFLDAQYVGSVEENGVHYWLYAVKGD